MRIYFLNKSKEERIIWIFLAFWLVINWAQAAFTGALFDEHYYWMYSRHLSWGYFDHPPAIAVIVKSGYAIFQNTFGIRFFIPILSTISIYLLWKVVAKDVHDVWLFICIVCSIVLVHAGGFSATPDVPLIFFACLFFYQYKKYLQNDNLINAILLSCIIAGLLYSKYHGLLVIFFTVISNLKLFTKKSFYIIILLSIALFLPHILWQIHHGYPTIQYQLNDRFSLPYKINFTTDYIIAQVLFAGGLSGIVILIAAFSFPIKNAFHKSLQYVAIGVFAIFLFSSFRGRVEANWAAVAFIPVIVLGYSSLTHKGKWRKNFMYLSMIMITCIIIFRIMMVTNTVPKRINIANEIESGWNQWAQEIKNYAAGRPVVFYNSYQKASRYTFYTEDNSYSLNTNSYRKTQYEIWETDSDFQGKDVVIIKNSEGSGYEKIPTPISTEYGTEIKNYHSYDQVKIELPEKEFTFESGEEIKINATVYNAGRQVNFLVNEKMPIAFYLTLEKDGKIISQMRLNTINRNILKMSESFQQDIILQIPEIKGEYKMLISLQVGDMYPGLQGSYTKIHIE